MTTVDSLPTLRSAPPRASLARNVSALYALQIANYIIPLLTLPYLIRVLGAAQYGLMAIAYALVFFLVLFVDAGFNTRAARELARPGIRHERIREIFAATQWIKIVQVLIALLVLLLLITSVPSLRTNSALYVASFCMVIGSLMFPTWLFQGLEIMHYTTVFSVAGRALAMLGIFIFVHEPQDLLIATALQASATLLSGLLVLPVLCKRLHLTLWLPRTQLVPAIKNALHRTRELAFSEYLTNAISSSGVVILSLFTHDAAVGIYAALEKLTRATFSVFQPLLKALFPRISGRWQDRAAEAGAYARTWGTRIMVLALGVALSLAILAPQLLEVLFGQVFVMHSDVLRLLSGWLFLAVCAAVLGQFGLLARGAHQRYAACLTVTGLVQLGACLAGAATHGLYGMAVAMIGAEALRLMLFAGALWRPSMEAGR